MQAHAEHVPAAAGSFLPHGFCYLWNPHLLWTHVVADVLIGVSYIAISVTLAYLVWRGRREFPFQGMFLAFGLFIVACGATHFVEVYTLWDPRYWFSAGVKAVTAVASVGTAVLLPPLVPVALRTVREARLSGERRVEAESAGRFRALAEAMPQIVWMAEPDGSVDYYNQRWQDHTGIPVTGGHSSGWDSALHPEDQAPTAEAWRRALETGEPYEIEHRIRHRDGGYRWLLSRALPMRDDGGRILRWFGTATDIDAQKRHEEEMRAARDAAQAANLAKDRFIAVMSHELRTPLNAVIGYTELLALGVDGPVTERQQDRLGRVRASATHLVGVIDQVLAVARSEEAAATPRRERLPLAEVVADAAGMVEPLARRKGLAFEVDVDEGDGDGDGEIDTDPGMLRQVLVNLLTNAVKFTAEGEVALRATRRKGAWELTVTDTGAGITAADRERIFEPFWQADQSHTRQAEGVGLGLTVSRRLVGVLGGELWVHSEPGRGSRFTVWLPTGTSTADVGLA